MESFHTLHDIYSSCDECSFLELKVEIPSHQIPIWFYSYVVMFQGLLNVGVPKMNMV
jgi:hypothetical protein